MGGIKISRLGTFALWFGWYGFNPGSTLGMHDSGTGALAAQVAMNTTISAATGGITVFVLRYFITKKYDVGGLCNGILAGLGAEEPWENFWECIKTICRQPANLMVKTSLCIKVCFKIA